MGSIKLPYLPLPTSSRMATIAPRLSEQRRKGGLLGVVAVFLLVCVGLPTLRPRLATPTAAPQTATSAFVEPPGLSHAAEEEWAARQPSSPRDRFLAASGPPSPSLPRAVYGDNITFSAYLTHHFPSNPSAPHLWITLADGYFAATGTANLEHFVRQLNDERRAKYGGKKRETRLVVLCLDVDCLMECDRRGMFAYGGFERTRPEQILKATWPKIASLMEILPHRDLFFVDSDVAFAQDPYPHMEPLMQEFDILAGENDAFEHFNTGWMWMQRGPEVAAAWKAVYDRDMQETSRDQYNFNTVLGTGPLRLHTDGGDPSRRPLKSNFTATNGLRVHVLDQRLFRTYHQRYSENFARHDSVFLHSTCADDAAVKLWLAKDEGFWTDLDGYYSQPPPLVSIDRLTGSQADLLQLFKIVTTVAHYTNRAVLLPPYSTLLNLTSPSPVRPAHSTFPLAQLADPSSPLGVRFVESRYVEHATAQLMGRSTVDATRRRGDGWREALGESERARRQDKVVELTRVMEIDMRQTPTLSSLLARILDDPLLSSAQHLQLVNHDWPGFQHWREWALPTAVEGLQTCARLEEMPACDQVCRFEGEKLVKMEGPWPKREELEGLPE
ncbi:hypothetical protein JCM10207_003075 [Rhodosporidiobolus poonsookiae]